jgi:hypothetical protein
MPQHATAEEIDNKLVLEYLFIPLCWWTHISTRLMWLSECLVSKADQVITYFGSFMFPQQEAFQFIIEHVLLQVRGTTDLHPISYRIQSNNALYQDLWRKGICYKDSRIISQLLFESILLLKL